MGEMLLLVVWNCQVKYSKVTLSVLMVLRAHSWKVRAHREFHLGGCQKPVVNNANLSQEQSSRIVPQVRTIHESFPDYGLKYRLSGDWSDKSANRRCGPPYYLGDCARMTGISGQSLPIFRVSGACGLH
jgi:hypothetical protein